MLDETGAGEPVAVAVAAAGPDGGEGVGGEAGRVLAENVATAPLGVLSLLRRVPTTHPASQAGGSGPQGGRSASLGPASSPGDAGSHEGFEKGTENAEPREINRLADALPLNVSAIDRAIEGYLEQIDHLGGTLSNLLGANAEAPWLIGIAMASAGCLTVRRLRRRRRESLAAVGPDGTLSSWLIDTDGDA